MSAFGRLYRLLVREILTRGRVAAVVVLGGVLVGVALIVRTADPDDPVDAATGFISLLGLGAVVPIVALLFASASLGDLRDDKTLVYLWLTPTRPWVVPLAAMAAGLTVTAPLVIIPSVLAAALTDVGGDLVTGTAVSVGLVCVAYVAVFTTLGLLVRQTLMWGLGYILIWEGFVASAGAGAARFALRAHARSILAEFTDTSLRLADLVSPGAAVATLALVPVGALAIAVRRYATMTVD